MKITASIIKKEHEREHPDSLFFSRNNMRFGGDSMSNYAADSEVVTVRSYSQGLVECYMMRRKRPVKGGLTEPHFFACSNFRVIHGEVVYE